MKARRQAGRQAGSRAGGQQAAHRPARTLARTLTIARNLCYATNKTLDAIRDHDGNSGSHLKDAGDLESSLTLCAGRSAGLVLDWTSHVHIIRPYGLCAHNGQPTSIPELLSTILSEKTLEEQTIALLCSSAASQGSSRCVVGSEFCPSKQCRFSMTSTRKSGSMNCH